MIKDEPVKKQSVRPVVNEYPADMHTIKFDIFTLLLCMGHMPYVPPIAASTIAPTPAAAVVVPTAASHKPPTLFSPSASSSRHSRTSNHTPMDMVADLSPASDMLQVCSDFVLANVGDAPPMPVHTATNNSPRPRQCVDTSTSRKYAGAP
jgi:hypothetical protein